MDSLQLLYQSHYETLIAQREHAVLRLEQLNNEIRDLVREARAKRVTIIN